MQRRIAIAIIGVAAMSLVLAGLGTLVVTHSRVRRDAQAQLQREAQALQPFITQERLQLFVENASPNTAQQRRLTAARRSLRLAGANALVVNVSGQIVDGTLPAGVTNTDLATVSAVTDGVSGNHGRLVWAAAASHPNQRGLMVVIVLTTHVPFAFGSLGWLALVSGLVMLLAIGMSMYVGRAIVAPLRDVDLATRRIAGGDLSTRVTEPPAGATDELSDLSRAINAMAVSLERSRGLEHQFLMSVSHDLRTPLTSIRGYAEAITDGAVDDVGSAAGVILAESRRLERLVHDLLDLAKLDARAFSFAMEIVEVASLVTVAAEGFKPQATAVGLKLAVDVSSVGTTYVSVDRDRFAQVLANLMENGLKYASAVLRVEVRLHPDGRRVAISVIDDGPGIAEIDLPHVFDRLYVSKAMPVRKEAGSGLGLAITRELVTAMGGTISAWPGDDNVGTRMIVEVPTVAVPHPSNS